MQEIIKDPGKFPEISDLLSNTQTCKMKFSVNFASISFNYLIIYSLAVFQAIQPCPGHFPSGNSTDLGRSRIRSCGSESKCYYASAIFRGILDVIS